MDSFEELQQNIFSECIAVLEKVSKSASPEELIQQQHEIYEVCSRIGFLKIQGDHAKHTATSYDFENQYLITQFIDEPQQLSLHKAAADARQETPLENVAVLGDIEEPHNDHHEPAPAASILEMAEKLPEIEPEKVPSSSPEVFAEEADSEHLPTEEESAEEIIAEATLNEEAYERNVELMEKEQKELQEEHREKKIRLASIKSLKTSVQSLFDDDMLAEKTERQGSVAKSIVPLDYMEAKKDRSDLKLDLNDRIAFTQKLFDGSQAALNETIQTLNAFKTVDQAREYLSDIYYQRKWDKAEDYAQRLWSLVENKFL